MAIDLYCVLGLESNASQKDVIRAYRLRAIQLHPDKKRTDEERAVATADFQALQAAYDVLRDPKKRAHYDATGAVEDSLEDIFSRWSGERPPIRREDIELFEKDYRGSSAEEDDVIDFFTRFRGDVSALLEFIPFSSADNVEQYIALVQRLINDKRIAAADKQSVRAFKTSQDRLRRAAKRYARRQARERTHLETSPESGVQGSSHADLVLALEKNKRRREGNSFLEALEQKYCAPSRRKHKA